MAAFGKGQPESTQQSSNLTHCIELLATLIPLLKAVAQHSLLKGFSVLLDLLNGKLFELSVDRL